MKITLCRRANFSAAHKIYNKNWSRKENIKVFGKCCNENFHGHNFDLIVKIYGEINKNTGMVINLNDLKKIIKNEIEDELDHKNLNLDIPYFKKKIPTTENIAIYIWEKLNKAIDLDCTINVVLYETPRNFVEFSGYNN